MPNITADPAFATETVAEKNEQKQAGDTIYLRPAAPGGGGGVEFGNATPLWQPDFMDPANSHHGSALTRSRSSSTAYPVVWRQYNQMVWYQTSTSTEIIVQGIKRAVRPYQDYDSVGDGSDDLHPKRTFGNSFIHDSYPNWQAATAYAVGDRIADVQNYMFYECTVAGNSGGTEPTWNLSDGVSTEPTTTDNEVTWVHKPNYNYTRYGGYKCVRMEMNDRRSNLDTVTGVDATRWQEKNAVPSSAFSQITTAGPTGTLGTYYGGSSLEINCPNTATSPWIESAPDSTQYSNVWHFLVTKSDNVNQEGCLIGRNDDVDGIFFNPYDGSFSDTWTTPFSGVEYHARLVDNSIWAVTLDWSNLSDRTGEIYIGPGYVATNSPATCGGDADIDIRHVIAVEYNEYADLIIRTTGFGSTLQAESDWTTPQSGNMDANEGTIIVVCEIKANSTRAYRQDTQQRAIISFNGDWDSALQFYPSGAWGSFPRLFMGGDGGSQSNLIPNMVFGPDDTLIFAVTWKTGGQLYSWYRNVSRGESFQFITRAFGTWDLAGGLISLFPDFNHHVVIRNALIYDDQKSEEWFPEYLG